MKELGLCPRCKTWKSWVVRRAKRRCAACRYEWHTDRLPLHLSRRQWKAILRWFVRGQSVLGIVAETGLTRTRILRALLLVRMVMTKDIPPPFKGVVEVDETYLGGQAKNKRLAVKVKEASKRGRGTAKQPVFGILCRSGHVWAELIAGVEASDLQPLIQKQVAQGSTICSDTWRAYTGIAAKGYVHRLVEHGKKEYSDRKGGHINGLEGFWGYLKRRLAAKGGITRTRLPLYLGEYVWRYNHRKLALNEQVEYLLKLLTEHKFSG